MPNHITNVLSAEGAPDEVRRFFTAIDGGKDENGQPMYIDFNKIRPMPESLNVESGSRNDRALDYYVINRIKQSDAAAVSMMLGDYTGNVFRRLPETLARKRYNYDADEMPELLNFGERLFNNIRNYGAPTWYEWSIQSWGTKWNAYDQERIDDNAIKFLTAWSGVPGLIQELSGQFPDVTMSYTFADENWGSNVGDFEFKNGECILDHQPPDNSPDARIIAEELLGPPCSNEDEDEEDWEDEV